MKEGLLALGTYVRQQVLGYAGRGLARSVRGDSPGGDAQFDVDAVAESAVRDYLTAHREAPIAVYTEEHGLVEYGRNPRSVLIVDPIDGTRPTSAGLEMGMVSIAHAPLRQGAARLSDVDAALLIEIKGGAALYGDRDTGLCATGFPHRVPNLSRVADLSRMFWSIEFNGHPMGLMQAAYGHLVDRSANSGGVFVFNSATYSISRIITGQLDAYVDIGNRILKDHPATEGEFRAAGRGAILHLFPYDIAAAAFLAELSGVVITDGYGAALGTTSLLDISPRNQQSCVAAATRELHAALLREIRWDAGAGDGGPARTVEALRR